MAAATRRASSAGMIAITQHFEGLGDAFDHACGLAGRFVQLAGEFMQ